jgi:hypothetical protein
VTQTSSAWDRFCGSIRLMFSIVPSPTSDSVLHIRLHAETYKIWFLSSATGSNIGPMPYYSQKYWTQKSPMSSQSPFICMPPLIQVFQHRLFPYTSLFLPMNQYP